MAPKFEDYHIVIVSITAQGQINPARCLARRLACTTGATVTLLVPFSAYYRMFPGKKGHEGDSDGLIRYAAFSDGYDEGFNPSTGDGYHFMSQLKLVGSVSLFSLASAFADCGNAVTCIISTIILPWVADVACKLGVPYMFLWTQSASVFAAYYHYFNGYNELIDSHKDEPLFTVELPGLPMLKINELPSILTTVNPYLTAFREAFEVLECQLQSKGAKPRVLINTFDELESGAITGIEKVDLFPIGPMVNDLLTNGGELIRRDLFVEDTCNYLDWLGTQKDKSVVYISFGSISMTSKRQVEEIYRALDESHRPFLWVLRNGESNEKEYFSSKCSNGMVVNWCAQTAVLGHPAVGVFVTHCGWNSMIEAIVYGVPMVMAPQWSDQTTNAAMAMNLWKVGIKGKVSQDGVLEWVELKRCLDLIMEERGRGFEIRENAKMWRDIASEVIEIEGPTNHNLDMVMKELEAV